MGLDNVMAEGQACGTQITFLIKPRVIAWRHTVDEFYIKKKKNHSSLISEKGTFHNAIMLPLVSGLFRIINLF